MKPQRRTRFPLSLSLLTYLLIPRLFAADSLRSHLEYGTSVSGAYDARTTLLNPAALGFQTESNGTGLFNSFSYGINRHQKDSFAAALALGYFGASFEEISELSDSFSRYGFSLGFPLSSSLYFGTRFRFTGSDQARWDGFHSWDLGLQLRPSPFISFGTLVNTVNEPSVAGQRIPAEYTFGITLRPIRKLDLFADVTTYSNSFAKNMDYQLQAKFEVFRGFYLSGGYHRQFKTQVGFQYNLSNLSFFGTAQPEQTSKAFSGGFQASLIRYPSSLDPAQTLKVELDASLGETFSNSWLLGKSNPALLEVLQTLSKARQHPKVKRVMIELEDFPLGYAAAEEVHEIIWELRKSGKQVDVFLGSAGLKEYFIAAAATTIHMMPQGELRLFGLKSERYYLKGTLSKVGIEGEFLAKGKYKSAPETFTEKQPTDTSRSDTLERLEKLDEEILARLTKSRNLSPDAWKKIQNHALYGALDAKEDQLIDEIGSFKDALEPLRFFQVRSNLEEHSNDLALPARVAVIVAEGDILKNKVRLLSLGGLSQVTPYNMERQFQAALSDPLTKAIVFRVSSGGGEVLASQEIADLVRRTQRKIPIIVSMGDSAASGGYMISAPAPKIYADSLTMTGSIGVFLGKFNLQKLYEKIDLHKEILTLGTSADLNSEDRPWGPRSRSIMQRRLNQYYSGFVGFVAKERNLSLESVESAAQGRVWLGKDAKALKLVDEEGGLLAAIDEAAQSAGLGKDNFEPWIVAETSGVFDMLGADGWAAMALQAKTSLPIIDKNLQRELLWAISSQKDSILYLSPLENIE